MTALLEYFHLELSNTGQAKRPDKFYKRGFLKPLETPLSTPLSPLPTQIIVYLRQAHITGV